MTVESRIESLLSFLEARDRQLSLPFSECGDDDRQEGGRFAPGNDCGGDGSGSEDPGFRPGPGQNPAVTGTGRMTTATTFPTGAWSSPDRFTHTGGIPGAEKIATLEVENPRGTRSHARESGIKSVAELLRFGAATEANADVSIKTSSRTQWTPDGDKRLKITSVTSGVSVDEQGGRAQTVISLKTMEGEEPFAYYDYFQVGFDVKERIRVEKEYTGSSPTERKIGAKIIDLMLESLAAAEESGLKKAKTDAAGGPGSGIFQGYRLWGRFGFDATVDPDTTAKLIRELRRPGQSLMSSEDVGKVISTGKATLQQVLSTKAGEKWWKENGHGTNMELDFTDKDSLGYKRFREFLDKHRRAKKRGEGRDYLDFIDFVQRSSLGRDLGEWRGFVEKRNCGTGTGGFQKGNTCAGQAAKDVAGGAVKGAVTGAAAAVGKAGGFPPAVATGAAAGAAVGAVKGLYDNRMRPTRAGKAIKAIGTTDEQVASMVKGLGGSPKSVAEASGKSAVTLAIKDSKGQAQFDVKMTKSLVRIKPASGRQNLSSKDIKQIKKIAQENSPKNVQVVVDAVPTSVLTKVVRAGGRLAVDATGALVAAFVVPSAPAIAGTAIEATTGIEIEKTKIAQIAGEKILGNIPKRRRG